MSGFLERKKSSTQSNVDPLAGLYQINLDENIPLEEEALVLMVRMLDNFEDFRDLGDSLREIILQNEIVGMHILSLLKVLIIGVQKEYLTMGYLK